MSYTETSIEALQADPLEAYRKGRGAPVAVTRAGVVLFYLAPGGALLPEVEAQPNSSVSREDGVSRIEQSLEQPEVSSLDSDSGLSVTDAAEIVGVHKSTVSRAVRRGRLPTPITREGLAACFDRPDLVEHSDAQ